MMNDSIIISFDIGIKNMAYCIIKSENKKIKIIDWNKIDLGYDKKKEYNINMKNIMEIYCKEYNDFVKNNENIIVLIENQPSLKNPVMKNISSQLYAYFLIKGQIDSNNVKEIIMISPVNKIKFIEKYFGSQIPNSLKNILLDIKNCEKEKKNKKYKLVKTISIDFINYHATNFTNFCNKITETFDLLDFSIDKRFDLYINKVKKKDDHCDCLIQAIYYVNKIHK